MFLPETRPSVDGGEQGPNRADAPAGNEVDADTGLVQRPEHAGVVGAASPGARQDERGAKPRGILLDRENQG